MTPDRPLPRSPSAWALVLLTPLLAWLGMMALHELGHVLGAWLTGGEVVRVVLHPLAISRTDVWPNPRPLAVAWAGPVVGIALPLLGWGLTAATGWGGAFWLRWFAGFCLIANGTYLGVGSFGGIGDAGTLLDHGAPIWTLWLFGLITAPAGLWLWHGLGERFGLGPRADGPAWQVPIAVLAGLVALLVLGLVLGR